MRTVVSASLVRVTALVRIWLLQTLLRLLSSDRLLLRWWLYRILSLSKFIHGLALVAYSSIGLLPDGVFAVVTRSSAGRIHQVHVVTFVLVILVEIFY